MAKTLESAVCREEGERPGAEGSWEGAVCGGRGAQAASLSCLLAHHIHVSSGAWELLSSSVRDKGTETHCCKAWESRLAPGSGQGVYHEGESRDIERVRIRAMAGLQPSRDRGISCQDLEPSCKKTLKVFYPDADAVLPQNPAFRRALPVGLVWVTFSAVGQRRHPNHGQWHRSVLRRKLRCCFQNKRA